MSSNEDAKKDRKAARDSKNRKGARGAFDDLHQEVSGKMRQLGEGTRSPELGGEVDAAGGKKRPAPVSLGGDYIRMQGRAVSKDSNSVPSCWNRTRKLASFLVKNHYLANASAVVVLFDVYLSCIDIDYRAVDLETPTHIVRLSDACLLVYSFELFLFLAVHGICIITKLWRDAFFMIDVIVLLCGYVELILSLSGLGDFFGRIGMLRLLRVARVLRLTKLLRKTTSLKELRRLLTMMATCMKALGWSFLICFGVMTFWAMLMVEIVHPIVKQSGETYFGDCEQCLRATQSVMDANLLLFKTVIAGDSWGQIAVPVIEGHPETSLIFVGSQLTLVFGVLNLIVAVVVDTFAEARQQNVLDLAEELEQDMAMDQKALEKIFNRIDADGSGEVTLSELVEGAQRDEEFRSRLQVMDIDEVDLQQLFEMIDIEGEGKVKAMEFVTPLSRWVRDSKTAPRFVKYNMMRLMHRNEEFVGSVDARFELIAQRMDEMTSAMRYFFGGRPSFTASYDSVSDTEPLEVGHTASLRSRDSKLGVLSGSLSKEIQRLSPKHKKVIEHAKTSDLEPVEPPEEEVEQPPLSKKTNLPSLMEEEQHIEQEALHMQEKAVASAFERAVEVLKQSLMDATEHALESSFSTVDLAMKEMRLPSSTAHPPDCRRPKLRPAPSLRLDSARRQRPGFRGASGWRSEAAQSTSLAALSGAHQHDGSLERQGENVHSRGTEGALAPTPSSEVLGV